jgi:hypothetical protein
MEAPHYVYADVSPGDPDERMVWDRRHWNKDAPHHVGADLHSEYSAKKKEEEIILRQDLNCRTMPMKSRNK